MANLSFDEYKKVDQYFHQLTKNNTLLEKYNKILIVICFFMSLFWAYKGVNDFNKVTDESKEQVLQRYQVLFELKRPDHISQEEWLLILMHKTAAMLDVHSQMLASSTLKANIAYTMSLIFMGAASITFVRRNKGKDNQIVLEIFQKEWENLKADRLLNQLKIKTNDTNKQPTDYIKSIAKKTWQERINSKMNIKNDIMDAPIPLINFIYIEEYSKADWDKVECNGEPLNIWAFNGDAFFLIEEKGKLDEKSTIYSKTPVIRYHLSNNEPKLVQTMWSGMRAGYGHIVHKVNNQWESLGIKWRY